MVIRPGSEACNCRWTVNISSRVPIAKPAKIPGGGEVKKSGHTRPQPGFSARYSAEVTILSRFDGLIEIKPFGEGVAVEQGVVTGPIEYRQHLA